MRYLFLLSSTLLFEAGSFTELETCHFGYLAIFVPSAGIIDMCSYKCFLCAGDLNSGPFLSQPMFPLSQLSSPEWLIFRGPYWSPLVKGMTVLKLILFEIETHSSPATSSPASPKQTLPSCSISEQASLLGNVPEWWRWHLGSKHSHSDSEQWNSGSKQSLLSAPNHH